MSAIESRNTWCAIDRHPSSVAHPGQWTIAQAQFATCERGGCVTVTEDKVVYPLLVHLTYVERGVVAGVIDVLARLHLVEDLAVLRSNGNFSFGNRISAERLDDGVHREGFGAGAWDSGNFHAAYLGKWAAIAIRQAPFSSLRSAVVYRRLAAANSSSQSLTTCFSSSRM